MPASILFHVQPEAVPAPGLESGGDDAPQTSAVLSLDDHLEKVESSLIDWALSASNGNKSKAADLLLISRSTLGDRIRRLRRNSGSVSHVSEGIPLNS
jgi:transcriptional regulator with PAS, ATPase and Fis domain